MTRTNRVQDAMAQGEAVDDAPFADDRKIADEEDSGIDDENGDGPPPADPDDPGPDADGIIDEFDAPDDYSAAERIIAQFCALLDQNDRDNGRRLVAWFGEGLCYVTGLGWLVWRGTHWLRDEAELDVRYLAQQIVDKIKLEALEIVASDKQKAILTMADRATLKPIEERTEGDKAVIAKAFEVRKSIVGKRSKRRNWAVTSGNAGKTSAMLQQAQSLKAVAIEKLDADPQLFNCRNMTLRFRRELDPERPEGSERWMGTVEALPHDRGQMLTKVADVDYNPEATCPYFLQQFLEKVQPSAVHRKYLQVTTAYALLIAGNDAQRMIYHYGTGANGKSVFIELIGRLAGTYRSIASPETVTGDGQRQGQQANPDIARLHNTRLVTIEELPKNTPLREELVKALTGGTKILARFLNKDFFEFMPVFVPVLSGNSKPAINGSDYGIWRRLLPVLWGVTIAEEDRIAPSLLAEKLDAERSGILNWLIEGLADYQKHGIDPFIPPEVREFWSDYREERDNVGVFLSIAIVDAPGSTVKAGQLFDSYTKWCEANGMRAASHRSFGDSLSEKGLKKKRGNYVVYLDVKLLPTATRFDPVDMPSTPEPAPQPGDPGWSPPL